MKDGSKTKKQLVDELISLRQQLAELMGSEAVGDKLIQDLQLSEDRMKYLITLSPVTIFMCRPSGDYGATYISSNITDPMGYESHEFTDDSRFWADHIHPEDRERVFEYLGALFERGYHIHVYRFLHKDGSYRWMYDDRRLVRDEKGNPVEIIGFWMDITDIKFAGRKLAESEERHRDLIDNISDGVYLLNRDGYFTYVNRAILERSELSENDFYRIKFSDSVVEEDKALAQANFERSLKGETVAPYELRYWKKDGSMIFVEINTRPIYEDGSIIGLQGISRDITERKREEREKQKQLTRTLVLDNTSQILANVTLDYEGALQAIAQYLSELIGDACTLNLLSEDGQFIHTVAAHHPDPDTSDYLLKMMSSSPYDIRTGLMGSVALENKPLLITDTPQEQIRAAMKPELRPYLDRPGLYSMLMVPMRAQGKVIGTVGLTRDNPGKSYTLEDQSLLQKLADRAALTIINARLYSEKRQHHEHLKNLLEALGQLRRDWENIFQAIGHPTVIIDRKHYIVAANRSTVHASGMPEKDLIGKKCHEIFHGKDSASPPEGCPMDRVIASGQLETVEMEMEALNGVYLVSCTPLINEQGDIEKVIHIAMDITDRKQAEERLRESEERFRSMIEKMPIGIFIYEGTKIRYINPTCERITGYKRSELYRFDIWEIAHPEFKDNIREYVYRRQRKEPVPELHEFKIITKNGEERWLERGAIDIELQGKPFVLVTVIDVTERKLAEEALKTSEQKYRILMENASDPILLADTQGNIVEANRKAEELWGYTKEELMQMHYTQLHPMSERERTIAAFKEIIEKNTAYLRGGFIQRKDGDIVPVDITYSVIEYAGRKVNQGSFRDISEHRRSKDQLEKLVMERTSELSRNNEQLKLEIKERKSAEVSLKKKTNELKLQADKLSELNIALKVLLKQREDDKNDLGEKVTLNVKELLLPSLEVLKNSRLDAKQKDFVRILESNLNEIISPFAHNLSSKYYGLTPREIEIANLIRQGKSTKEITNFICISNGSIIVHRNHIRKKLGIISKKINLRSHLMSLS